MNSFTVDCEDGIKGTIKDALSLIFSESKVEKTNDYNENLISAVYGNRKIRYGAFPSFDQQQYMLSLIKRYENQSAPIRMITNWGSVKVYGKCNARCGIDIWDVMAIHRLNEVAKTISNVYSHGVKIQILSEDITEKVLGSCNNLPYHISQYTGSLSKLAEEYSNGVISVIKESEVLNATGQSADAFIVSGIQYGDLIYDYWKASSEISEEKWENLDEYKALKAIGWNGIIPNIMREYYINRCGSEYPNMDVQHRIQNVCRYFGNSLTRHKTVLSAFHIHDEVGQIPCVKVGFGTMPAGVSQKMLLGRVDYKIKESKGNSSIPPWVCWGCLKKTGDKFEPSLFSARSGEPTLAHRVNVTLNNKVDFSSDMVYSE